MTAAYLDREEVTVTPVHRMPIFVGDDVLWYPHADKSSRPMPAKVLTVAPGGALGLSVFQLNARDNRPINGARHIDDPILQTSEEIRVQSGGWDYTARYRQHLAQQEMLEVYYERETKEPVNPEPLQPISLPDPKTLPAKCKTKANG